MRVQCNAMRYITVRYNAMRCDTVWYVTVWYNRILYYTVRYKIIRYNMICITESLVMQTEPYIIPFWPAKSEFSIFLTKPKIESSCSSVQTCLSVDDLLNTAKFQRWVGIQQTTTIYPILIVKMKGFVSVKIWEESLTGFQVMITRGKM